MHQLHVLGLTAQSLPAAVGAIRFIPGACLLVHEPDQVLDPGDERVTHTGPLLTAPPGLYHLWVTRYDEPLVITAEKVILGRQLLLKKALDDAPRLFLKEADRKVFYELLTRTDRQVHVWQEARSGHQKYRLLCPGDVPSPYYDDTGNYDYPYVGVADLKTGRITLPTPNQGHD